MTKRIAIARSFAVLLALSMLAVVPAAEAQLSETVAYQGFLTDAEGTALDGAFELAFRLFDAETDGTLLWTETYFDVPVEAGVFSVQLGSVEPLTGVPLAEPLYLEVIFGEAGEVLAPRVPLTAVPYSLRARSLDDHALVAGDNVTIERENGALVISAAGGDGGGGGTITGVTAGTGLTGGGNAGTVTLALDDGGVGTEQLADGAVTGAAIADSSITGEDVARGAVVRSVNGLTDDVTLEAGTNVTIEETGAALRISAIGGGDGGVPSTLAAPDGDPAAAVVVDDQGRVGIGTTASTTLAPLHVRADPIDLPLAAIQHPGLVVEAEDATVGIYSSEAGTFGSALVLGEINGNQLVDKWSLVRETSTGTTGFSRLRFTYGGETSFVSNETKMTLLPQGFLGLGTLDPESHLHMSGVGDVELILEADTGNLSGNRNPAITLRQDGNRVNAFVALEGNAGTLAEGTLFNALVIGSEDNNPAIQFVTNDEVRMTIGTDGAITTPPRTSVISIPPMAFVPEDPRSQAFISPARLHPDADIVFPFPGSSEQTWYAPVQLPHGAVVTKATSYWDDRQAEVLTIRLERSRHDFSQNERMAILSSNSASGEGTRTDATIENAVIDNRNFQYFVRVHFPVNAALATSFKSVVIEYTTTQIQ